MAAGGRPVGVTVVAVLAVIGGILQIIGGISQMAGLGGGPQGALVGVGVFYLLIGIATVAVGVGLLRGSRLARIVATVVFVLGLLSDVVTIIAAPGQAWVGIVGALLRIAALVLLYTRPANAFFAR